MSLDQIIVLAVLACALALFAFSRLRYDVVAVLALMVVAIAGIVPPEDVFDGFGHPAVITVAMVLILSNVLNSSGAVEAIGKKLQAIGDRRVLQAAAITGLVALCSTFMNNIGALALFMPVALQLCHRAERPPSEMLMPLSFASLLGGLITLIGTPPNIIIANYRGQVTGEPFGMFDYAPVGLGVAAAGVAFISLIGWRLLPHRQRRGFTPDRLFEIDDYIMETRLPEGGRLVGKPLRELERYGKGDVSILALVRGGRRRLAPPPFELLKANDALILEGHPDALKELVDDAALDIAVGTNFRAADLKSERVGMFEAVVSPGAPIEGRSASLMRLHERYGVNLLAISRQGQSIRQRVSKITLHPGDVLLLQGEIETMAETLAALGCLPLAQRNIRLGRRRQVGPALVAFGAAIAATALGLLQAQVAFTAAVVMLVLTKLMPLREVYRAVDWPVIVLLGAMIPVGQALENTSATALLAGGLLSLAGDLPGWAILGILMVCCMALSDVVNNAATAVIMAPIGASMAHALGQPVDPFLMAVAVGSSATFLTPIGHQSNTLVMGPGGYAFGDYWRMGLPVDAIVVTVAVPLITTFWPLDA